MSHTLFWRACIFLLFSSICFLDFASAWSLASFSSFTLSARIFLFASCCKYRKEGIIWTTNTIKYKSTNDDCAFYWICENNFLQSKYILISVSQSVTKSLGHSITQSFSDSVTQWLRHSVTQSVTQTIWLASHLIIFFLNGWWVGQFESRSGMPQVS